MRNDYDDEHDALLVTFRDGDYDDSVEIYPGFVVDLDTTGRPIGLDIYYDASKFVDIAVPAGNTPHETLMRYQYDRERDSLFVRFREGEYDESKEIYPGLVDFDKSGRPIGLDFNFDASKFVDIEALQRNVSARKAEPVLDITPEPMLLRDVPPRKP